MRVTCGPAPTIIQAALELGVFCRPIHSDHIYTGEALEVSNELFWWVNHDGTRKVHSVSPIDLTKTWELTTMDIIRAEWLKLSEDF